MICGSQVMQQKSNEFELDKCVGDGDGSGEEGDERHARRLLAAAEEALTADCDLQVLEPTNYDVRHVSNLVKGALENVIGVRESHLSQSSTAMPQLHNFRTT